MTRKYSLGAMGREGADKGDVEGAASCSSEDSDSEDVSDA